MDETGEQEQEAPNATGTRFALVGFRKGMTFDWLRLQMKEELLSEPLRDNQGRASKVIENRSQFLFTMRGLMFALIPIPASDCGQERGEKDAALQKLGIPQSQEDNLLLPPIILKPDTARLLETIRDKYFASIRKNFNNPTFKVLQTNLWAVGGIGSFPIV